MTAIPTTLIIAGINAELQLLPTEIQLVQDLIDSFNKNAPPVTSAELEADKAKAHALADSFASAIAARVAAQKAASSSTAAAAVGSTAAPSA